MLKIKHIAVNRRARTGPPYQITSDGEYWLALDILIDNRGCYSDFYRVRHYRNGELRAYCEREVWRGAKLAGRSRVRCDQTLEAETIEDLIFLIGRVPLDRESYRDGCYEALCPQCLERCLPEIPLSRAAPDDVVVDC